MPRVGVRDLKNRASEILRSVREEGAEYVITYQGRPTAVLLPVDIPTSSSGGSELGRPYARASSPERRS